MGVESTIFVNLQDNTLLKTVILQVIGSSWSIGQCIIQTIILLMHQQMIQIKRKIALLISHLQDTDTLFMP